MTFKTKIKQMYNMLCMLGMKKYVGHYIINISVYPEFAVVISDNIWLINKSPK